jgi:hypothetical protein
MPDKDFQDLFGEGWRDPGDDTARVTYYLAAIAAMLGGMALFYYGTIFTKDRVSASVTAQAYGAMVGWAAAMITNAALCAGGIFATLKFFRREIKKWDMDYVNAEKVISNGFLISIAMFMIGTEMIATGGFAGGIASFYPVFAALVIFFLSFLGGLFCAMYHRLPLATETLHGAMITGRYALTDKAYRIPDHFDPGAEGYKGYVMIRTHDGRHFDVPTTEGFYALCKPGAQGKVTLNRGRMVEFVPERPTESEEVVAPL